jgi:hypothetical protein
MDVLDLREIRGVRRRNQHFNWPLYDNVRFVGYNSKANRATHFNAEFLE